MRVHIAHIQVTNPLGILTVGFITLLRFRVFWMGQSYPAGFLKDIKHRYPKLTGGFHTNIVTVVFGKPVSQFLQAFCKGGKASLLILCTSICVSNSHTGLEGRHLCRGDLDGLAGVGIAAPTGAAPIFSNYVTPSQ